MASPRTPMSLRAHNREILAAFLEDGVDIRVRLSGFSMKPLLRSGSVLRFSARVTPRVGDIVLLSFTNGAADRDDARLEQVKLVAHRVLALDDEYVWTKGDASGTQDPPVPRCRVLASATTLALGAAIAIPLRNAPMRALGLLTSSLYPRLVRAYRAVWPRKDAFRCAT